jgi:hypothetical protein
VGWERASSFGFSALALCVGKNQMCLNARWLSLHGTQQIAKTTRVAIAGFGSDWFNGL